jgi:aspartate kinase
VKDFHLGVTNDLFPDKQHAVFQQLDELFAILEDYLAGEPGGNYDFEYDQIVSFGEMFSTVIVSDFLDRKGISNTWFDARDLIHTDNNYRDGKVNWDKTAHAIHEALTPFFSVPLFQKIALTQGFIACSDDGATTTLAREGSDFSAAILAYCMDAEEVIIWKDVIGLLNADPKYYPEALLIPRISYAETLELAFYGASVLHPNTIKPLENKKIPLRIKSFLDPEAPGTLISAETENTAIIPSFIFKEEQVLITFTPRDFSYVNEHKLHIIFGLLSTLSIKINLMQNSAISFSICIDHPGPKLEELVQELQEDFKILYNEKLRLITIRNYNVKLVKEVIGRSKVLLEQKSRYTAQILTPQ